MNKIDRELKKEFKQMKENNKFCPYCHRKRKQNWRYCPYCGGQVILI